MTREKAINVLEDALSRAVFMDDIDVLKMAISALREQPRWISVEERLPTEKDANPNKSILAIEIREGIAREWIWDSVALYPKSFTHWMPMPKLPKEEA